MFIVLIFGNVYSQKYSVKGFVGDETGLEVSLLKPKVRYSVRASYYGMFREHKYYSVSMTTLDLSGDAYVIYWNGYDLGLWLDKGVRIKDKLSVYFGGGSVVRLYTRFTSYGAENWEVKKYAKIQALFTLGIRNAVFYKLTDKFSVFAEGMLLFNIPKVFAYAYPYKKRIPITKYFQGLGQFGIAYFLKW